MILFGSYTSPYVRHCRIVLNQLGCVWTLEEADYAASAKNSPTKKVPYFSDGAVTLTDSSSIIKYVREKHDQPFIPDINDFELYCLVNTVMDTAINLFLLEKDGLTAGNSSYLRRQQDRLDSGLDALNNKPLSSASPLSDGETRLACFLDWGLFRNRFSLDNKENLKNFLDTANQWPLFAETAPPRG